MNRNKLDIFFTARTFCPSNESVKTPKHNTPEVKILLVSPLTNIYRNVAMNKFDLKFRSN